MPVKITDAGTKKAPKSLDALLAEGPNKEAQAKAVNALSGLMTGTSNVIADEDQIVHIPDEDDAPVQAQGDTLSGLVDELADLIAWADEQKKDARHARLAELKKLFEEKANEAPADDEVQFYGAAHTLKYGKRSNSRSIIEGGKAKIIEFIGAETFMEIAGIALKDVDAYLTPKQKEQVLETTRGGRSLKVLDN